MPYVRDSFWSGRQFTSLEHMQAEALLWATNVAGQRQCRPLGGAEAADGVRGGGGRGHAPTARDTVRAGEVVNCPGGAGYSRQGRLHALVKTHAGVEQGKRTDKNDYPPEKIAFQMRTPIWCRSQASQVGDACREVIREVRHGRIVREPPVRPDARCPGSPATAVTSRRHTLQLHPSQPRCWILPS